MGALLAVVLATSSSTLAAPSGTTTGVVVVNTRLAYGGGGGAGTGIVLSSSGTVLTNNHVIRGADAIRVTVPSTGRTYAATVAGYSVSKDIALLKLRNAQGLATVRTGNSNTVDVGDSVTAVGNAGGTGKLTTKTGKVTGLSESITVSNVDGDPFTLPGLIETTAPLRGGDSGGPLLSGGRVIGIDAAAAGGFYFRGSAQGYAIPINRARKIARQIDSGRQSSTVHVGPTAFLGVGLRPATRLVRTCRARSSSASLRVRQPTWQASVRTTSSRRSPGSRSLRRRVSGSSSCRPLPGRPCASRGSIPAQGRRARPCASLPGLLSRARPSARESLRRRRPRARARRRPAGRRTSRTAPTLARPRRRRPGRGGSWPPRPRPWPRHERGSLRLAVAGAARKTRMSPVRRHSSSRRRSRLSSSSTETPTAGSPTMAAMRSTAPASASSSFVTAMIALCVIPAARARDVRPSSRRAAPRRPDRGPSHRRRAARPATRGPTAALVRALDQAGDLHQLNEHAP